MAPLCSAHANGKFPSAKPFSDNLHAKKKKKKRKRKLLLRELKSGEGGAPAKTYLFFPSPDIFFMWIMRLASNLGCDDFSLLLALGLERTPGPEGLTLDKAGPDSAMKEREKGPHRPRRQSLLCGACQMAPAAKCSLGAQETDFNPRQPLKQPGMAVYPCHSRDHSVGRKRQEDPWDALASQPGLLGQF